jgi:hypothetical protein
MDNIKMDFENTGRETFTGFKWFRMGSFDWILGVVLRTFGRQKRGILLDQMSHCQLSRSLFPASQHQLNCTVTLHVLTAW